MLPEFDEVVGDLKKLAEVEDLDPDARIADLNIESLDLLEWLFDIAERHSLSVDETILDDGTELTLRGLWQRVTQAASSASG